jgi:hypothetical protein
MAGMKTNKHRLRELVTKGTRVVSEAAEVLATVGSDVTPLGLIAVAAKLATSAVNNLDRSPLSGWPAVDGVAPLDDFLLQLCTAHHIVTQAAESKQGQRIMTGVVNGVRVGWVMYERWNDGPYTIDDPAQATAALRAFAWQALGQAVKFHQPALGSPMLLVDPITETLPSETAERIWCRQAPYLDRGYTRSVLLIGEPGTGKSNIIRFVAGRAGGLCLRVKARDLEYLRSLGNLVRFLCPDAVLIDDLDRAKDPAGILDELDELLVTARLLLVTVNNVGKLDAAALRRFEDVELVQSLDAAVLDKLLEGASEDVAMRLRGLPVRYVHQYCRAAEVIGTEEAAREVDGLVERRELVKRMSDAQGGESAETKQCAP